MVDVESGFEWEFEARLLPASPRSVAGRTLQTGRTNWLYLEPVPVSVEQLLGWSIVLWGMGVRQRARLGDRQFGKGAEL